MGYEEEAPVVEHVMSDSLLQAYLAEAWELGFGTGCDFMRGATEDHPENPYWRDARADD